MKITLTLTAGISIDSLNINGFETSECGKHSDNSKTFDHGHSRESKTSLESLGGSAKGNFDLQLNFDLQPEELQGCYSCIQELVKTVADSHHHVEEVVEKTTEVINNADTKNKATRKCDK